MNPPTHGDSKSNLLPVATSHSLPPPSAMAPHSSSAIPPPPPPAVVPHSSSAVPPALTHSLSAPTLNSLPMVSHPSSSAPPLTGHSMSIHQLLSATLHPLPQVNPLPQQQNILLLPALQDLDLKHPASTKPHPLP